MTTNGVTLKVQAHLRLEEQMGLDIGIIDVTYLKRPQRPHGIAYEFAWEMAVEASVNGYMHGEGNNWAPFSQHQVLRLLDRFASERALDAQARTEIF